MTADKARLKNKTGAVAKLEMQESGAPSEFNLGWREHRMCRRGKMQAMQRVQGFTYLAVLFSIAIMGAGLAATGVVWHQVMQREKEVQLLFIGHQFRDAIGLYYQRTPGTVKRYPQSLEDLLLDKRHLSVQRYLRRIYRDPMTGKAEWGTIRAPDGGIMGVHSLSQDEPIKASGFSEADHILEAKLHYANWQFIYAPAQAPVPTATR